jgi:AcrR family transcriptional regulator
VDHVHPAARSLIDAAERLVAEHGLAALTVQAVQREAHQRNKSAVQYHFGGREGLITAVLADRMAGTETRRTSMLLALPDGASTRQLVEVLLLPLIESVLERAPSYWARFLIQTLSDPASGLAALEGVDTRALDATQARLRHRLPDLPQPVRTLRVQSTVGYATLVLAAYEAGALPHLGTEELATEIIDAGYGLLAAPSTLPADGSRRRANQRGGRGTGPAAVSVP